MVLDGPRGGDVSSTASAASSPTPSSGAPGDGATPKGRANASAISPSPSRQPATLAAALSLRGVEVSSSSPPVEASSSNGTPASSVVDPRSRASRRQQQPLSSPSQACSRHEETLCAFLATSARLPWLSDVLLVCRDGVVRASRLILACASPKFLKQVLLDDAEIREETTILLPEVTKVELSSALELIYKGQTCLEGAGGSADKYRGCLKLVSCLGIPIEALVVETKLVVSATLQQSQRAEAVPATPTEGRIVLQLASGVLGAKAALTQQQSSDERLLGGSRKRNAGGDDEGPANRLFLPSSPPLSTGTAWSSASSTSSSSSYRSRASSPPSEDLKSGSEGSSMYHCDLCQRRFPFMEFLRHQDTHRHDLPYACPAPSCGLLRFRTQAELRSHRRQAHKTQVAEGQQQQPQLATTTFFRSSNGSYICPHCKQSFNFIANMRTHLLKNHMDAILKQNKLSGNSQKRSAANQPSGKQQQQIRRPSDASSSSASTPATSSRPSASFPAVDSQTRRPVPLPASMSSGVFRCKMCHTVHHSWEAFSKHFLRSHGTMPKMLLKYKCVPCDVTLPSRAEYLQHCASKHSGDSDGKQAHPKEDDATSPSAPVKLIFAAPVSNLHSNPAVERRQSTSNLASATPVHQQQQQQQGRSLKRQCDTCQTSFKTHKSLKRHFEQRHSTESPRFRCQLCPRAFRRSDNLAVHVRVVHNRGRANGKANGKPEPTSLAPVPRPQNAPQLPVMEAPSTSAASSSSTASSSPPYQHDDDLQMTPALTADDDDSLLDDVLNLPSLHLDQEILNFDSYLPDL